MTGSEDAFFRASAGVLVINATTEILTLERSDRPGSWQAPQGGIHETESPREAAMRELEEETGIDPAAVEVLAEHDEWLVYEVPRASRNQKVGWGQAQKWFLLRVTDPSATSLTLPVGGEFSAYRWTTARDFVTNAWEPRQAIYRRILDDWDHLLS